LAERVLGELEQDFAAVKDWGLTLDPQPLEVVNLRLFGRARIRAGARATSPRWPLFGTRHFQAYGWGARREVHYGDFATVISRNLPGRREFEVYAPEVADLYEQSYLAILSTLGESLDRQGFHRVHALGFARDGENVLAVLPSGGGKSALASLLLDRTSDRIFSDESPLLTPGGVMLPFATRFSLVPGLAEELRVFQPSNIETSARGRPFRRRQYREKRLFPVSRDRVAAPGAVTTLLIGRRAQTGSPARWVECSRAEAAQELARSLVVGVGLAQMTEHLLRFNELGGLSRIAMSRVKTAWEVASRARCLRFEYSANAFENFSLLKQPFSKLELAPSLQAAPSS
jgi:hypothetical protein